MSQKIETFADINLRRLQSALSDAPIARNETHSPENLYFTDPILNIPRGSLFTCAIASVVNSVRSLGIKAEDSVPSIATRLLAAQTNRERNHQPALIKEVDKGYYFVTDEGIKHLFNIVRQPIGKAALPIKFEESFDMGKVHQALCHGYKAIGVIDSRDHAVAFTGVKQEEDNLFWQVIPPDTIATQLFNLQNNKFENKNIIPIIWADVLEIALRVNPHFFIVGDELNQWELPSDRLEVGPDIELNFD